MGVMTSPASDSLKEIHMRLDERVRAMDEPRWLASRYAAEADRTALIVLYAFYYELARVRVAVTDQTDPVVREETKIKNLDLATTDVQKIKNKIFAITA